MPYNIVRSDGTLIAQIADQSEDITTTSLTLVGRGHLRWGDALNTNLVHMLEHFASATAPVGPMAGQLWFDAGLSVLKLYQNSNWSPLATEAWVTQQAFQTTSVSVNAGTYTRVTVDAAGFVTDGASLLATDVTAALGYRPLNASSPSGDAMAGGLVTMGLTMPNAGGTIEMGSKSATGNPTLLFHSSGSNNYADAMITSSGGTAGSNYSGTLICEAHQIYLNASSGIILGGQTTFNGSPVTTLSQFVFDNGSNGFQKLAGGMIMQWGTVGFTGMPNIDPNDTGAATRQMTVTFSTTFPTTCLCCFATGSDNASYQEGSEMSIGVQTTSTSGARFLVSRVSGTNETGNETGNFSYLAIGY